LIRLNNLSISDVDVSSGVRKHWTLSSLLVWQECCASPQKLSGSHRSYSLPWQPFTRKRSLLSITHDSWIMILLLLLVCYQQPTIHWITFHTNGEDERRKWPRPETRDPRPETREAKAQTIHGLGHQIWTCFVLGYPFHNKLTPSGY
jgi:hypothetical protein